MKRYLIATVLVIGLGVTLSAIAQPNRTASAAHSLLASVGAAVSTFDPAAQQSAAAHNSTLNRPRLSKLDNGRVVVAMESSGDIRGDMTLILDTDPAGTVTGGTWALVSSYVEDVSHEHSDAEHAEGGKFINDGTLNGNILSGSVLFSADGSVNSVNGIQLEVKGGSLTFSSVSQGDGLVSGSNLSDQAAATGSLVLNF